MPSPFPVPRRCIAAMRKPLNVSSIGYFNRMNYGDDLLQLSIADMFQNHALNFLGWVPSFSSLNESDLIIVGGGSIWPDNSFFARTQTLLDHIKTPYAIVGISARRHDEEALRRTQKLAQKALFFHTRDAEAGAYLGASAHIHCGADLFWWSERSRRIAAPEPKTRSIALNLRSWTRETWSAEALVSVLRDRGQKLLPMPMFLGAPLHDGAADCNDIDFLNTLGLASEEGLSPVETLQASALVISMRFHGLLMGLDAGRPIIGFDYHPKIRNLFAEIGFSRFCIPLNAPDRLAKALDQMEQNYTEIRSEMLAAREALRSRGAKDRAAFIDSIEAHFDKRL